MTIPDRVPPGPGTTMVGPDQPLEIGGNAIRLRPVADAMLVLAAQKQIAELIGKILKEGTDYGVMPGGPRGGEKRKVLFKAGAERVNFAFDVRPEYTLVSEDVDHNKLVPWRKQKKVWRNAFQGDREFNWEVEEGESLGVYRYVVRCQLVRRDDGMVVGEGYGSASTLESKYVDRPRDSENTVLKIAKKRAFVDATLTAYALSDRFTQDIEDGPGEEAEAETPRHSGGRQSTPAHTEKQAAAPRRREANPTDWTDEERDAIVAVAKELGYDAPALKRVLSGLLGHYPPQRGEESNMMLDTLRQELALKQASAEEGRPEAGETGEGSTESSSTS